MLFWLGSLSEGGRSLFFFRLGSHSTSDDQTAYQDMKEVERWWKELHPTKRLKNYLVRRNLWDEERDEQLVKTIENDIKVS